MHPRSVTSLIEERLPSTLLLVAVALILGVVFGVLLGVLAAVKKDTWIDHMSSGFAILNVSIPPFYLGILLILVFAVELRWLPVGGMGEGPGDTLKHLILPAIVSAARIPWAEATWASASFPVTSPMA